METPIEPGTQAEETVTLLRVEHVSKRFPQVLADDNVSFDVRRGEIHCLLGENGAGKVQLAESSMGRISPMRGPSFCEAAA